MGHNLQNTFIISYVDEFGIENVLSCHKIRDKNNEFICKIVEFDDSLMEDFIDSEIKRHKMMKQRYFDKRHIKFD